MLPGTPWTGAPGPGVRFSRERDKAYALEAGVQQARGYDGKCGAGTGR